MHRVEVRVGWVDAPRSTGGLQRVYFLPSDFGSPEGLYSHLQCGALFYVERERLAYELRTTLDDNVAGWLCPECGGVLELDMYPWRFRSALDGRVELGPKALPFPEPGEWVSVSAWCVVAG